MSEIYSKDGYTLIPRASRPELPKNLGVLEYPDVRDFPFLNSLIKRQGSYYKGRVDDEGKVAPILSKAQLDTFLDEALSFPGIQWKLTPFGASPGSYLLEDIVFPFEIEVVEDHFDKKGGYSHPANLLA